MADDINPSSDQPLYFSKEFAFTKMNIDRLSNYSILYLYSAGMLMHFGL